MPAGSSPPHFVPLFTTSTDYTCDSYRRSTYLGLRNNDLGLKRNSTKALHNDGVMTLNERRLPPVTQNRYAVGRSFDTVRPSNCCFHATDITPRVSARWPDHSAAGRLGSVSRNDRISVR